MDHFSKRLKSYREKLKSQDPKWTQEYMAEKIGVARVTYTGYENGTKTPPLETVNRISDIFNVSIDYLQGRTDDPNRSKEEFDDPEIGLWFKELKEASPERQAEMKRFWEFIKQQEKDRKSGDKQGE